MKYKTTSSQFCPYNTGSLLRSGAGELHALIFTQSTDTAEYVTFYDNTTGTGTILLRLHLTIHSPISIFFPPTQALKFSIGLYVATGAHVDGFVILAF